ncbi:unnamed protein product, partial [Polarella glacialis]
GQPINRLQAPEPPQDPWAAAASHRRDDLDQAQRAADNWDQVQQPGSQDQNQNQGQGQHIGGGSQPDTGKGDGKQGQDTGKGGDIRNWQGTNSDGGGSTHPWVDMNAQDRYTYPARSGTITWDMVHRLLQGPTEKGRTGRGGATSPPLHKQSEASNLPGYIQALVTDWGFYSAYLVDTRDATQHFKGRVPDPWNHIFPEAALKNRLNGSQRNGPDESSAGLSTGQGFYVQWNLGKCTMSTASRRISHWDWKR